MGTASFACPVEKKGSGISKGHHNRSSGYSYIVISTGVRWLFPGNR